MKIGLFIIGDEILSGRRKDQHLVQVVEILKQRGLALNWCRVLSDELELLVKNFRETLASDDLVLCTGGIGATPDDLTRHAVAAAANLEIEQHPEGLKILQNKFGDRLNAHRLRMIEFPKGTKLIPNPLNQIPGFSLNHHYCVPGFPEMAWPMLEWVLDTYYSHLTHQENIELAIRVYDLHEGDMIPLMEKVMRDYGVKIFSLPNIDKDNHHVELGVKGTAAQALQAMSEIKAGVVEMQGHWSKVNKER